MSIKPYTVEPNWQGGRILVERDDSSFGGWSIYHLFTSPDRAGCFAIGWKRHRKAAIAEAEVHARARMAPLFVQHEVAK